MTRKVVDGAVRCPDCERWLALNSGAWGFKKSGRPHSYCRECAAARAARWFGANRERGLAAQKAYRRANPEKARAAIARHKAANPDRYRDYNRASYARRDRDAERARLRALYLADPAAARARNEAWLRANPEKARLMLAKKNARRRGAPYDAEAKEYAAVLLRDPCCYCGDRERPSIEHIVPLSRGGTSHWSNLAGCCAACNSSKAHQPLLRFLARRAS
jgi:5-methylcytosine-specific restriction endonuclease McrA